MADAKETPARRKPRRSPPTTPEGWENHLINLAVKLAEQQLERGTASAQVITHYLKLASVREQLERDKLRQENLLLEAKTTSLASADRIEKLYKDALKAMRIYSGRPGEDEYEDQVLHRTLPHPRL